MFFGIFLFGPRQTGKTFLLKHLFPKSPFYNLLLSDLFLRLTQRPQLLKEELIARGKDLIQPVIVDEIQKLPLLLDEIHYLIAEYNIRFILTGSSPRKLIRGGANLLAGRHRITPKTELFGKVPEHFIYTELKAYLSYTKDRRELSYWHSYSGHEVDFIICDEIAIEVKASTLVNKKHAKGLKALSEEVVLKQKIIISTDPEPRKMGDILVFPVREFLRRLWAGEIVS